MKKSIPLLSLLNRETKYVRLKDALISNKGAISVFGMGEGNRLHMLSALYRDMQSSMLIVLPTDNHCLTFEEKLQAYGIDCIHFPAKTQLLGSNALAVSGGTESRRTEILVKLLHGEKVMVLASCECIMQRLAPKSALNSSVIRVETGMEIPMEALIETLASAGYERAEICDESCLFAVRGGRVDVFPSNSSYPIRIEFFGDEIDTMRSYDPEQQRSIENIDSFTIYPATEVPISTERKDKLISKLRRTKAGKQLADELCEGINSYRMNQMLSLIYDDASYLYDYMPEDTVIVLNDPLRLSETAENEYKLFAENVRTIMETEGEQRYLWDLMASPADIMSSFPKEKLVMFSSLTSTFSYISPNVVFQIDAPPVMSYTGSDDLFLHDVLNYIENGYSVIIFGGRSAKKLTDELKQNDIKAVYCDELTDESIISPGIAVVVGQSMPEGFEYREMKLVVLTENELYGLSMHRKQAYGEQKARSHAKDKLTLSSLSPGDYVVHDTNGIARFQGIKELEVAGKRRDYIVLQFAGADMMYVPCEQLEKIQKYQSGSENPPKLSKLNSNEWKHTVERVKRSVKELAFNLVALYGERMSRKGYRFSNDSPEQELLEMSFPYDETPDQLVSIREIKADMESDKIMDRLLCGDVGFGKTEVALRAAFKAVSDCKQVAILVPTTVLAYQHYNTMLARLSPFGVRVDFVSRFKSPKEIKETLKKLKNGEIDLIIGTHRLLSKDVEFADLGLLIIDEEQRFGVGHKESIKQLKKTVDVLTLTATPIPRTMHMSLIGIRDISILDTPPKQRYPVQTFVTEYNESLIRDAVLKELGRGGQVYFLYNSVKHMPTFYSELCKLIPEARITYAHGQMPENELEATMLDFIDGKFDVLLSSTIIENGLDVPNANTLIVYAADKLGLAQLYQLRGRVGRSKRIGFAYFTYEKDKVLTQIAEKRLTSIAQFTQLGSGYKIAMRDLQIRGAGDILGPQQHGHMEEVGYEMYSKLVSEAVAEVKGYKKPEEIEQAAVEIPIDAYIPKTYIENEEWRLDIYKKIAQIESTDDCLDVEDELLDRFGDIPKQAINLINVSVVRALATKCYIKKVTVKSDAVILQFADNAPYDAQKLIGFVSKHSARLTNEDESFFMQLTDRNNDKSKVCESLIKILTELSKCLEGKR